MSIFKRKIKADDANWYEKMHKQRTVNHEPRNWGWVIVLVLAIYTIVMGVNLMLA